MEEKSNLLSKQVAKSANNVEGKSGVAKRTCSVIKQVRVSVGMQGGSGLVTKIDNVLMSVQEYIKA